MDETTAYKELKDDLQMSSESGGENSMSESGEEEEMSESEVEGSGNELDYYMGNDIREKEKSDVDISKEKKSDNIDFYHVSSKKKVSNNKVTDRKDILKQFIDSHYEIVDIAEGTDMTLLYQCYTESVKSEEMMEFAEFQRILTIIPEIKSVRRGPSKTLFVNLKPDSLQCQEFYNQMNTVYLETCKNLDKQVEQEKETIVEELYLPVAQHPSVRNRANLYGRLESEPSSSQTVEHLGTLREQVNDLITKTVNGSIKSNSSTKNAGKKKRNNLKQLNLVIKDNTLKVCDLEDFPSETFKKNGQKVEGKKRKIENVSTILAECNLSSEKSMGHVELTVPNEVQILSLIVKSSTAMKNGLIIPLGNPTYKKLCDSTRRPKRSKSREKWIIMQRMYRLSFLNWLLLAYFSLFYSFLTLISFLGILCSKYFLIMFILYIHAYATFLHVSHVFK